MQHGTKGKDEKLYRFEHSDISRFRCSEVLRFSGIVRGSDRYREWLGAEKVWRLR